ncbi:MAG: hypothetical protein IT566_16325 [Rhodospirillaceae bacterium]|nr:hypothetical protein [Rhodospirillaceae bacterium]
MTEISADDFDRAEFDQSEFRYGGEEYRENVCDGAPHERLAAYIMDWIRGTAIENLDDLPRQIAYFSEGFWDAHRAHQVKVQKAMIDGRHLLCARKPSSPTPIRPPGIAAAAGSLPVSRPATISSASHAS